MRGKFIACMMALWASQALAQGVNASLSGRVADPSGAVVAGALLTLQNIETGVETTTISNETGIYQFPSVQPGPYSLLAERTGFQSAIYSMLTVEVSAQVRQDINLQTAPVTESVEVTADLTSPLAATTPSIGGVIDVDRVRDLPLPSRYAPELVETQGGAIGGHFSGLRRSSLNVTKEGINIQSQYGSFGVQTDMFESADAVAAIRVITSAADAELGRGLGQVQISTRAGGNEFHGSIFESHRNTALNANSWFNNQAGIRKDILLRNQFGARLGGPIVPKKTFFHILYDGKREVTTETVTNLTYTESARQGNFRYFPGVVNANALAAVPTVDIFGNPVKPATATGDLATVSVFGRDPNRPVADTTGVVQMLLATMPLPNNFRSGDGLTTAGITWNRPATADRDQFSLRIDHHFNEHHWANLHWAIEDNYALNGHAPQNFPDAPAGLATNKVQFLSVNLTSVLSPQIVNEVHAGMQQGRNRSWAAWERPGQLQLPTINGVGYVPSFMGLPADVFPRGPNQPTGGSGGMIAAGDNLTWTHGRHTFKAGGEGRSGTVNGFVSLNVVPVVNFGAGGAAVQGLSSAMPGNVSQNQATAGNLLLNLSGSVRNIVQSFHATPGANPAFTSGLTQEANWREREMSFFFKDDWKARPNLTLNFGIRYEYYGVPWDSHGRLQAPVGGAGGLFGISGTSFADLYQPGRLNGSLTKIQYVGPNTPHPDQQLYNDDWNNFAPAAGLSWAIPYFGRGKTILRVGYQMGYEKLGQEIVGVVAALQPGARTTTTFTSAQSLNLTNINLPLVPAGQPFDIVPLTDRSQDVYAFDDDFRAPYVQNWNFTIQRELPGKMYLQVAYAGSKGTKLARQININEVNIFETGILDAFRVTQAGGDSPLLHQIFNGLTVANTLGPVNGSSVTASQSLRMNSNTRGFFANNNVGGFADYLNTTTDFTGIAGELLRRAGLPENWIVGNPQFHQALLVGNFANSTYHGMQIELTRRSSRGWSLQANYTWSRTLGEESGDDSRLYESTSITGYRNGRDRHADKRLLPFHRTHVFRSNGMFELPFGPGKRFLNSNGVLARLFERWQFGAILNLFSGEPIGFKALTSTVNQYTNNNTADIVVALPKDLGRVTYDSAGVRYFAELSQITDPGVSALTTLQNLQTMSRLQAITTADGAVVAVNPQPGVLGNMARSSLEGPGAIRFDLNLLKRVRVGERTEFEIRADALNVLNHPNFANPNTDINSSTFGRITNTNGDSRIIVVNARINF